MELNRILEILKSPEKIVEPGQCNIISSWLSGYITDLEELENEQNYQVSVKHAEIYEQVKKLAATERALELTDIYRQREKTKLTISQLRRLRSDLKDRFRVLTETKYR